MDIVDFHAHILPGCDHGSSSSTVSLAQLRLAKKHGVTRIVATSHFYPQRHSVEGFVKKRSECYEKLMDAREADMPEVKLGAEVLICDNIDELPGLSELCISGTKALLLELPFSDFSSSYISTVKYLIHDGYDVILAHADRYDKKNIEKLIEVGAKIQLNAGSLSKLFVKGHLYDWMKRGLVYAIGSDIHKADETAYKNFEHSVKKSLKKYAPEIKAKSDALWDAAT